MSARAKSRATAPQRTCIGCRRVAPPDELVRVTVTPGGELVVSRRAPGRGAWLCAGSPECVVSATRRKAFGRALRAPVTDAAMEALRAQLGERARIEVAIGGQRED